MKDKIQTAIALAILVVSALLLVNLKSNSNNKSKPAISKSAISNTTKNEIKSEQSKNIHLIIDALNNYSDNRMMNVISKTYDESILKEKSSFEIVKEIPENLKQLNDAELEKIISETPGKVSLKLKKNDSTYILDIFFFENSQKIKKMGVARLN